MTTPNDNQLLRMDGWPGGVNNRVRETEQVVMRDGEAIPSSQFLRRALNVDLTAEGHPLRRQGYTQAVAGFSHSAWFCREQGLFYVVSEGNLYVGTSAQTLSVVTAVNRYLPMSYTYHVDRVYFMNGADSGMYDPLNGLGVWPDASLVPRPEKGNNGDPPVYPSQGSHEFPLPTADRADTSFGDEFVSEPYAFDPMPVGQLVFSFKGRLYVAQDDTLWFSEPMQPHYMRSATNLYTHPRIIAMAQPVDDGIYVGDDEQIAFYRGTDPFNVVQTHVYPHGVVPKAFARIPGEKFGVSFDEVPVWWAKDGVMLLGLPGGTLRQLTRDRLAIPEFGFGAVSLREREGISQVVSSLQKGGDENNMAATDTVVAEIRRNDITLDP